MPHTSSQARLSAALRPALPSARPAPIDPTRLARFAQVPRRVHFLGAGGAGVSGAARILVEHGHQVSGHDRALSEHVLGLRALGVEVQIGESETLLPPGTEMVVRSAAVGLDDPRVALACEQKAPVLKYSELLRRITPAGRTLAVAGTHGKTSTAWLLFHALAGIAEARGDEAPKPGALIGGICRTLGTSARSAEPQGWFGVEACEYDRSFLQLSPQGAIVTNVEEDHLDYFGTFDAIKIAFAQFVERAPHDGLLVLGRDVPRSVEEAARASVWRLGREVEAQLLSERQGRFTFRLRGPGFEVESLELAVPGRFQVDNASQAVALAVGTAAREAGLEPSFAAQAAAHAVERYLGSKRRFEPWGSFQGVELVHDYAHHPTEVRVTLEAARRAFPGRALHVLFQPHQHSRTARFFAEFVEALRMADRVVVADVYGARSHIDRTDMIKGAAELADALSHAGVDSVHGGDLARSTQRFVERLPSSVAGLILGAGDVELIQHDLHRELALRRPSASLAR